MEKEIGDINVDVNKNINESDGGGDRDWTHCITHHDDVYVQGGPSG